MKRILLIAAIGVLFFVACDPSLKVVDMPDSVADMDFREFNGDVEAATLPDFTGTAVSASDIDTLLDPEAPASAMNVIPAIAAAVEQAVFAPSSRSVAAYGVFAFSVADETVVLEDELGNAAITVSVNELNALWSASWEIDQISDELESFFMGEAIEALGTLGADYTAQLKVNAEVEMDPDFTGIPVAYASWHHLSNFLIDASNVVVTFDDTSGDPSFTGTVGVDMEFSTSVGFVISGAESMNGKYIVTISMEPVAADVSIADLQTTIESNSGPGSTEEGLIEAVIEMFTDGEDVSDLFRLEYAAYDNDGDEIASVRMPLVDAIILIASMGL